MSSQEAQAPTSSAMNESDTEEEKGENVEQLENGEERTSSPSDPQPNLNGQLVSKTGYLLFRKTENSPIKYVAFYPFILPTSSFGDLKQMILVEFEIPVQNQIIKFGDQEIIENESKLLNEIFNFETPFCVWVFNRNPSSGSSDNETSCGSQPSSPSSSKTPEQVEEIDEDFRYTHILKRPAIDLVGLKNQGATCYLNSLIQVLFFTPEFRKTVYEFPRPYESLLGQKTNEATQEKPEKDIIFQIQMLFAKMQSAPLSSVSTTGLTTSFGWDNSDIFVQHDVQELNRVLCDKLEEKMKGTDHANSIAALYKGVMSNLITCKTCNGVSSREEDYYDISLVIKGKKNIIESLNEFTTVEVLQDDNAYFCERCQGKQTAEKCIKFKTYPKILNLQLKRFEYDWNRDVRVKLHDEIDFPLFLEMDPFTMVAEETLQKTLKKDENEVINKNNVYELFGICVHSGNAGFGHYYAFIKSFIDGKWYKFNDDQVTRVDESDIKNQNWFGETRTQHNWQGASMYHRSATPYMLVYRRNETSNTFIAPPIPNEEIPTPIRLYIEEQARKKEEGILQQQREADFISITILRNRLEYPVKVVKISRQATLEELKNQVVEMVQNESNEKYVYRFRRVANRKNATKRAMNLFPLSDYSKPVVHFVNDKKPHLYLEQEKEEVLPSLDTWDNGNIFLSVRQWSSELRRPVSVRDFVVLASLTLGELKEFLSPFVKIDPSEMRIFEEETESLINLLGDDSAPLSKYKLMSGDILHVEQSNKELKQNMPCFSRIYYQNKQNELLIEVEEGPETFKKRIASQPVSSESGSSDITPIRNGDSLPPSDKDLPSPPSSQTFSQKSSTDAKISFKLYTNISHEFSELKQILSSIFGVNPQRMRVYAKDISSYSEGRLLKDLHGTLDKVLTKYRKITTSLYVEIIDAPEDLKKGDKLFKIRYYNTHHEFSSVLEIKINKTETIKDLKLKLKEKTGVHEDNQVISEWFSDHFFKFYSNNDLKISESHIRKNDIIRMDALKDSSLNLSNKPNTGPNIAIQLVQFKSYEANSYGKREMQTSFPSLFMINENYTIFELRKKLAEEIGLPFYSFNFARCPSFPIYQEGIEGIRGLTEKSSKSETQPFKLSPEEEAEIEKINQLMKVENKEGKGFDFKNEKMVSVKKLRFSNLQVIIWEDLRKNVEEPNQASNQKSKTTSSNAKFRKRDTETLKIKN